MFDLLHHLRSAFLVTPLPVLKDKATTISGFTRAVRAYIELIKFPPVGHCDYCGEQCDDPSGVHEDCYVDQPGP